MEFVIIATVVLVLAMCLGADFVIVPIMFIVFLVVLLLVIFLFLCILCCKTYWNEKRERKVCAFRQGRGQEI